MPVVVVPVEVPVAGLSSIPSASLILTVMTCVAAFELASVAVTVAVNSTNSPPYASVDGSSVMYEPS